MSVSLPTGALERSIPIDRARDDGTFAWSARGGPGASSGGWATRCAGRPRTERRRGVFQRFAQEAAVALHRAGDPYRGMPSGHHRTLKRTRYGAAAFWDLHRASLWRYVVSRGLRLPTLHIVPAELQGRHFHEVPDPFEPLVHLWTTGYALERISAEHLVLVAPRPDAGARRLLNP